MKIDVNVPVIEFVAALLLFATCVVVQGLAAHVNELNIPSVPHVAVPPPKYPALHLTRVFLPVVPMRKRENDKKMIRKYIKN